MSRVEQLILEKLTMLPESLKEDVLMYVSSITETQQNAESIARSTSSKRGGYGLYSTLWMAEDFDAPLEDFNDYM